MPYYAVVAGRNPGMYTNWDECKEQIDEYPHSWYKKFNTENEANTCLKTSDFFAPLMGKPSIKKWRSQNFDNFSRNMPTDYSKEINISSKIVDVRKQFENYIEQFTNKIEIIKDKLDSMDLEVNSMINYRDNPYQSPYASYYPMHSMMLPSPNSNYSEQWEYDNHQAPPIRPLFPPTTGYVPPLIEDEDGYIDVYIDGAVSKNGTARATGGIGVWFNHGHPLNVAAKLDGRTTNMNAELQAATRAIQQAAAAGLTKLNIHTDSLYTINCMTKWVNSWRKNNWQTVFGLPVKNREQVKKLDEALNHMESIKWTHIKSHQGNVGNENADVLAHAGVSMSASKRFRHAILPLESN